MAIVLLLLCKSIVRLVIGTRYVCTLPTELFNIAILGNHVGDVNHHSVYIGDDVLFLMTFASPRQLEKVSHPLLALNLYSIMADICHTSKQSSYHVL